MHHLRHFNFYCIFFLILSWQSLHCSLNIVPCDTNAVGFWPCSHPSLPHNGVKVNTGHRGAVLGCIHFQVVEGLTCRYRPAQGSAFPPARLNAVLWYNNIPIQLGVWRMGWIVGRAEKLGVSDKEKQDMAEVWVTWASCHLQKSGSFSERAGKWF